MNYLRDAGNLWAESPRNLQREFVREVFQRIGVEGKQVTAITPEKSVRSALYPRPPGAFWAGRAGVL